MDYFKLLNGVTPANGGYGDWYAPEGKRPGKWMPAIPNPVPCERGYHVVTADHLLDWAGTDLWRVEVRGEVIDDGDKHVVGQARLLSRVEGWTPTNVRLFAAVCAAEVLHLFESVRPGDDRPRKAVEVGAAGAAARDAARAAEAAARAARAAAGDAAWAARAAGDAAWERQQAHLRFMLDLPPTEVEAAYRQLIETSLA